MALLHLYHNIYGSLRYSVHRHPKVSLLLQLFDRLRGGGVSKSLEPWTPLSPDCSQYTHSWEGKCHFFHISSRNWAQTEIKKLKITFPFDNRYDLETIFARNRLRINNACFPLQLKAELSINTDKDSQHCQKCHTRLLSCCPPPRLRLSCCCCGDMLSIQPPDDLQLTVRLSSGDEEVTDIPLITSDSGRQKPSQHKRR